jgi:galactokinase
VPGRIEVFGKHTDYAGGRSLLAAAPLGITVSAEAVSGGRVRVADRVSGEAAEFSATGEGPAEGWRTYPQAVVRRLAANFPSRPLSCHIALSSHLPQAAGMSSSSALIVAIAEALIACCDIESSEEWRREIRFREDRAGYFGCIENGADFRTLSGGRGVGTHGGSEDHAAIVLSEAGRLKLFSYAPIHLERAIAMPSEWTFVVAASGVSAEKTGSAMDAYNRLALDAHALSDAWRADHPDDGRSLGQLARAGALRDWRPPDRLRARLEHFLGEDARAAEAADAFARGDIPEIDRLAAASHAEADRLLGNQVEETRTLVSIARELGAAAASSFGAGWGGSVWALVKVDDATMFAAEWLRAYRRAHPGLRSTAFVSPPSGGGRRY